MIDRADSCNKGEKNKLVNIREVQSKNNTIVEMGHSCSVKGAILFTHSIDQGLPLMHGGPGCSVHPFAGSIASKGEIIPIANSAACSENIIFGGEEKLKKAIVACLRIYKPEILVVTAGCQTATVGDNVEAVIDEVKSEKNVNIPMVDAQTSGYDGDMIYGYVKTGLRLLSELCEPQKIEKNIVNVLGAAANYHLYWRGDNVEISNLLGMCGLKVNCIFPGQCNVQNIKEIPKASLNVVVDEQFGLEQAEYLKDKYGTPYVAPKYGAVIGGDNTTELFNSIIETLKLNDTQCRDLLKTAKENALSMACQGYFYWHEHIMSTFTSFGLNLPAGLALGMTSFLMGELGIEPKYINFNPTFTGAKEKLDKMIKEDGRGFKPLLFENADDKEVSDHLGDDFPQLLIGPGCTHMKADSGLNGTFVYLDCSYPTVGKIIIYDRPLMGFNGVPMFIQEIIDKASYFV